MGESIDRSGKYIHISLHMHVVEVEPLLCCCVTVYPTCTAVETDVSRDEKEEIKMLSYAGWDIGYVITP